MFLVRGGFRKCKPFVLSWGGFLQAVLVPGGAVRFVVVWVLPRGSCTRLCLWFGFLQAVFVPGKAVRFVVVWVFPRGSFPQLCLLCWAVFVSASRGAFCGVGFCKRYWFLAGRFVL